MQDAKNRQNLGTIAQLCRAVSLQRMMHRVLAALLHGTLVAGVSGQPNSAA